jgi:hypothetical protein
MCNADWLSICRRPMQSGLPKQRNGRVLDHDGDRRFAEECVQIARTAKGRRRPGARFLTWLRTALPRIDAMCLSRHFRRTGVTNSPDVPADLTIGGAKARAVAD